MNLVELLLGGAIGVVLGMTVQAYFKPLTSLVERKGRESLPGHSPIYVHVDRDPRVIWSGDPDWIGFSVYVDDPLRINESGAPTGRDAWLEWASVLNAVDALTTPLRVTVQARVEAAVVVENVRVAKHRTIELQEGIILTRGVGGADLEPRRLEIDLDWGEQPLTTWRNPSGDVGKPLTAKLAAGDIEQVHIWANAQDSEHAIWHEWSIELEMLVEGVRRTQTIDDDGRPFVTVSPGRLPRRVNYGGTSDWGDWPS